MYKGITKGWHRDISNEEYHKPIHGYSSSNLKSILSQSPHKFNHYRQHPKEVSALSQARFNLGTAVHTLVLEPHKFDAEFVIWEKATGTGSQAKNNEFLENNKKIILNPQQRDQAVAMALAVGTDPDASKVLANTLNEQSIFWREIVDGQTLDLKVRPDAIGGDIDAIIDLKTVDDISEEAFAKSVIKFGYHISAAFYLHGINRTEAILDHMGFDEYRGFVFVCVETAPPYEVAVYTLDNDFLTIGYELVDQALRKLARGQETNWKREFNGIASLSPTGWYKRIFEQLF